MVKQNSFKAWILAARPKTLTGAMIPVMFGAALAYHDGCFDWKLSLLCALFACCMQIAANFVNDLYDFLKGTDREDRLGPERACAQGWISPSAMKKGIACIIGIACIFGLLAVALSWDKLPYSGLEYVALGIACVVFAILYTTVFSYLGLGDILVLVFFGFVPVCGTYFIQSLTITADCLLLSLISGIAIDALLVINNYRDRNQDKISGKKTNVVLFGEKFGRYLYLSICLVVVALMFALFLRGTITWMGFFVTAIFYSGMYIRTWLHMVQIGSGKQLNIILGETSRNMLILGVFLSLFLL